MASPWLDLVDVEFGNYVGGKIFEIDFMVLVWLASHDEVSEGVGGDCDAITRLRGELQIRARADGTRPRRRG